MVNRVDRYLATPGRLKWAQEALGTDDNSADLLYPSEVAQARRAAERMGWRLGKRRGGKFMLIDTWGGVIAAEVTLREVWEAINRPSSVRYRRPQRPSP